MDDILYFRSRYSSLREGENHGKKIPGRRSEVGEIRAFEQNDDARDIAWKQSAKSETEIFTKTREGDTTHNIILIKNKSLGDDFCTSDFSESKDSFFRKLDTSILRSKKVLKLSYSKYVSSDDSRYLFDIEALIKGKIQNSIIFILTDSLQPDDFDVLKKLGKQNDVIILHVFHPIEINPSIVPGILFDSGKIHTKKYIQAFDTTRIACEKFIKKSGLSYLFISSDENPVLRLNFYFKHRYAR